MKIIAKIRDLFLHPSWVGFFLLLFLYGLLPYILKEMGYTWNEDLFFYSSLILITILSFAAYRLIGIEYVDKVKVYSPKKKWKFSEVIMLLSAMTIFITLYIDRNSSDLNGVLLFAFCVFFISMFHLLYLASKEKRKGDKLVRLILTKTKIVAYTGFRRLKKAEYDLNNLIANLEPENQLKLIITGEEQENTRINLNNLKEEDRIELLAILLN